MRSFLAAVVIAFGFCAPVAMGQIDPLPPSDRTSYTQAQEEQIAAYMLGRVAVIGGDDAVARERARAEILSPLRRAGVSVAFRRVVEAATLGPLTTLADNADEGVVTNALFVLAEIGTDATRQAVQQHTDDESQAVRFAAVAAMKQAFRVVNNFSPAIDQGRVLEMVSHLARRLAEEQDAQVGDGISRALLQASRIRREGFETPATRALVEVGAGVGARLRHADPTAYELEMTPCLLVGEEFVARLGAAGNPPSELSRAGAAFGGEMLAHLAFAAKQEGRLGESRHSEVKLAQVTERCVQYAQMKLGGTPGEPGLAALLEAGKDQEFAGAAGQFVLLLSGKPCELPAADMQRIRDALDGK